MSPLVQRARVSPSNPNDQHWSMLLFESLSGGVLALAVGFAVVMTLVGVFVMFVWPITFWDLTDLGLEKYGSWASTVVWSVFAGGSLAGYWCFSGAAFKDRSRRKPRSPARPSQSRR